MKPNAIKKKVGTLKYYLDQTISSSPTDFTDEQVSEIILKYFTGLESSPSAKGKKYIKGARKTVTLTDGKTPTTLSLSTGASFKVSTAGDTVTFTSEAVPAKGDASGVTSQFVHTIKTADGTTTHSFTQTRMVGDRPISQETFTVELPQGSTFSKDNLPNIFVADSSYSQVDPLAPRIATPVQNKPVAVVPVVPTALVPVQSTDDEEQVLTHIPGNIPLGYFLNNGQTVDQRLASRLRPTPVVTTTEDNININQGDTHMADTPRREEQGFNIVDESGNVVRRGTRTNEMHFESLEDWATTCREIEQANRIRVEAGQTPIEYPQFQTQDGEGNPVTHTYVESSSQNPTGLVPAGGQRRERTQTQGGGLILRPTNPTRRREEVVDPELLTTPVVRPREEGDDTVHIVEEDSEEIRLWRQQCAAIDEENRLRETQGKKPKKYPRQPKAQVHKKGKKPVNNPSKLKKVLKTIGKVVLVVAVATVVATTAIFGKLHYDKFIAEPESSFVDTDNKIQEDYFPEVGEVESTTEEDATLTPPPSGEVDTDVEEDEVSITPVVPDGKKGDYLKNPSGGAEDFGPGDDVEGEEFEDTTKTKGASKGLTDTSGTQTDFSGAGGKAQKNGAPINTTEELELGQ